MMVRFHEESATASGPKARNTTGTCEFYDGTTDGGAPFLSAAGDDNVSNMRRLKDTKIEVVDIRGMAQPPQIVDGFWELDTAPTTFTTQQFRDVRHAAGEQLLKTVYWQEVADYLQTKMGADLVIPFNYKLRTDHNGEGPDNRNLLYEPKADDFGPLTASHVDKTPDVALAQFRAKLCPQIDEYMGMYKRIWIVNHWRPVGHKVERFPLALIDGRGIDNFHYDSHTVNITQGQSHRGTWKAYQTMPIYDARYKFVYASHMEPDEVLLFRDCDVTGVLPPTPHAAFVDDNTRPGAPGRQSIEVRSIVCFKD